MRVFWIYVLLLWIPLSIESFPDRDARGSFTENFTHLQIQARLSLPSVSYVEGEDIPLEFHITNHGKEVVRIFPALDSRETFQLQIRDDENRLIPIKNNENFHPWNPKYNSDNLQKKRNHIENLAGDLSKEIALAPGESFTRRIILQESYELEPGKNYTIQGYFYPNATESKKNFLLGGTDSEGRLSFMRAENTIRFFYDRRRKEMEISGLREENLIAESSGVSPEETIFLFLGAELKMNWTNYFKWIYLPDFILAYDNFSGHYLSSTDREKEMVVDEFKQYLTQLPSGRLKYFKVISVDYISPAESRVKVFAERLEERIPTRYEYEYRLKKDKSMKNSLWKVHGVVARVKK